MIPIKRNILFFVAKEKDKEDGRLKCKIRWDKKIVEFNLGYRVDISKWVNEAQSCKANTTHGVDKVPASDINRAINIMYDDLSDIFYKYEVDEVIPTVNQVRDDYNLITGKIKIEEKQLDFFDLIDLFIKTNSIKNSWSKATFEKFNGLKRHFINFKREIKIDDINEKTLSDFVYYLQTPKALKISGLKGSHGLRNSTIKSKLVIVRWVLRWLFENGYYKGNLHDTFKPRLRGLSNKEVIYLEWEELMTVLNTEFEEESLNKVRDVFCFCCFTGLRYSDVAKLKKEDVAENHINVVTQKTEDRLIIDLNKYSKSILGRYKEVELDNGLALPVIANQNMNDKLKIIGMRCNINEVIRDVYFVGSARYEEVYKKWELLTTHCGRRTFVVNSLALGIPAEVIMKWTGHKDFKTMKPYIAIVDDLKKQEMDKFNSK